jgi:hypothetical protein
MLYYAMVHYSLRFGTFVSVARLAAVLYLKSVVLPVVFALACMCLHIAYVHYSLLPYWIVLAKTIGFQPGDLSLLA